jgi:uncharacterized YccA/Bax inhibitor family protein
MWQSSNPALNNDNAFRQLAGSAFGEERTDVATLSGVVNRTSLLISIAVVAGAGGYSLVGQMTTSIGWITAIAAFGISIGVYFVVVGNPERARYLAPVYAIAQGGLLGAVSGVLDRTLEGMGYAVAGGVALQAFVITISILMAMLMLYKLRIIRPTRMFRAVVGVATTGIMITYALSFFMSIFFGAQMPFLSLNSAFAGGTAGLIGLGINVLILGVASMWLIIDFKLVEDRLAQGSSRSIEWYLGFALLVTLAWIYLESVKLVFRLAILFGGRD